MPAGAAASKGEQMKTFITQDGLIAGLDIEAFDFAQAVGKAEELGLTVIGELKLTICNENMTNEKADEITKRLSESIEL